MELFIAIAASAIIGMAIGLLGAGGSILIMPILVYVLEMTPSTAIPYSLGIVGITSLVSSIRYAKHLSINVYLLALFGIPAFCMTFFMRAFIIPSIPHLIHIAEYSYSIDSISMILLALLMAYASKRMITKDSEQHVHIVSPIVLSLFGIVIGIITGLTGIGGGFLIVPIMILFGGMNMREATFTSMVLIACTTLPSFVFELFVQKYFHIDIFFFLLLGSLIGSFWGVYISHRIHQSTVRKIFGIVIAVLSFFIIIKEIA